METPGEFGLLLIVNEVDRAPRGGWYLAEGGVRRRFSQGPVGAGDRLSLGFGGEAGSSLDKVGTARNHQAGHARKQ
jgi:hypothetical protein